MSDYYELSATAKGKKGELGIFSIIVSERDSEVTSRDEHALSLWMAAEKAGVYLLGPLKIAQTTSPSRTQPAAHPVREP